MQQSNNEKSVPTKAKKSKIIPYKDIVSMTFIRKGIFSWWYIILDTTRTLGNDIECKMWHCWNWSASISSACRPRKTWWRHQMETFSALLAICAENSPVSGEFATQRPVTRGFDVYFDLRPDKRLSKQTLGWWFETPSHSLWRHRNDTYSFRDYVRLAFGQWEVDTEDEDFRVKPQRLSLSLG